MVYSTRLICFFLFAILIWNSSLTLAQTSAPISYDPININAKPSDSLQDQHEPDPERNRKILGTAKILAGVLLLPIGYLVTFSNSLEKCDKEALQILCSESEPSKTGETIGDGMLLTGLLFVALGIADFSELQGASSLSNQLP